MDDDEQRAGQIIRALAVPNRRAILRLIRDREMSVGEIAREVHVTTQAISRHLNVLREAGLVRERRAGRRRLYRADGSGTDPLRSYLDDLWGGCLSRARRLVEAARVVVP